MIKKVSELREGDTFLWRRDVAVVHDIVEMPSAIADLWSLEIEVPGKRWRGAVQARGSHTVEVLSERRGSTRSNPARRNFNTPAEELAAGTREEFEHTKSPRVARKIAQDHLREDPRYYTKLQAAGLMQARRNPSVDVLDAYKRFHGREPKSAREFKGWFPGELVIVGRGVDVGYNADKLPSTKKGHFVHEAGSGVKVYKRCPAGTRPDLVWQRFPVDEMWALGHGLGFTYEGLDGKRREVKGSKQKYLASLPSRDVLLFVGPTGIEYVIKGGRMRVDDWIYD